MEVCDRLSLWTEVLGTCQDHLMADLDVDLVPMLFTMNVEQIHTVEHQNHRLLQIVPSPLHNQQMIKNDILRHLVDLQEADKLRKPKESLSAMQLLRKPQSLAYMWPTLAQLRWPKSAGPDLLNKIGNHHALTYVQGDKYYGAKANINMWEPKIQLSNEFSLSQSWILAGSLDGDLNSIEAGWQDGIEKCQKLCGEHRYLCSSGVPDLFVVYVLACTYEGDNIVVLLQAALEELGERVNGDMRMALKQLQYTSLSFSAIKYADIESRLKDGGKDEDITPFTTANKFLMSMSRLMDSHGNPPRPIQIKYGLS